jgi:hypothetical protein
MLTTFQSENLKGRDHLGDLSLDKKILLKWILKETGDGYSCTLNNISYYLKCVC